MSVTLAMGAAATIALLVPGLVPGAAAGPPALRLGSDEVRRGGEVRLEAEGLTPGVRCGIHLVTASGEKILLADVEADGRGRLALILDVPANVHFGSYDVELTTADGVVLTAPLRVVRQPELAGKPLDVSVDLELSGPTGTTTTPLGPLPCTEGEGCRGSFPVPPDVCGAQGCEATIAVTCDREACSGSLTLAPCGAAGSCAQEEVFLRCRGRACEGTVALELVALPEEGSSAQPGPGEVLAAEGDEGGAFPWILLAAALAAALAAVLALLFLRRRKPPVDELPETGPEEEPAGEGAGEDRGGWQVAGLEERLRLLSPEYRQKLERDWGRIEAHVDRLCTLGDADMLTVMDTWASAFPEDAAHERDLVKRVRNAFGLLAEGKSSSPDPNDDPDTADARELVRGVEEALKGQDPPLTLGGTYRGEPTWRWWFKLAFFDWVARGIEMVEATGGQVDDEPVRRLAQGKGDAARGAYQSRYLVEELRTLGR